MRPFEPAAGQGEWSVAAVTEDTKFVTMDLREDLGRDWEYFPDLNTVAFRRGLSCEARVAALDELQRTWKGRHLRLAQSA